MPGNIQSYFPTELYVQSWTPFLSRKSVKENKFPFHARSLLDFKKQRDLNGDDKNNRTPKPNAERFMRRTTHSKLSS